MRQRVKWFARCTLWDTGWYPVAENAAPWGPSRTSLSVFWAVMWPFSRVIWTDSMSTRKECMREDTVAAIALPGGIGTLDELIETHVLCKLGKYQGRVFALNLDGFYNPLKALLDHYVNTGMMDPQDRELLKFPDTVEELISYLK